MSSARAWVDRRAIERYTGDGDSSGALDDLYMCWGWGYFDQRTVVAVVKSSIAPAPEAEYARLP